LPGIKNHGITYPYPGFIIKIISERGIIQKTEGKNKKKSSQGNKGWEKSIF
jgi:hypothetical protein